MFRYMAFSWSTTDLEATHAANHLVQRLQASQANWRKALNRSNLQVFHKGARPNTNTAYVLGSNQGAILGRVFRREDTEAPRWSGTEFTDNEVSAILDSRGRKLMTQYWGRYVALLLDPSTGGICVIRDPSGTLPCFVVRYKRVWIFCSWIEDVMALGLLASSVNWDYIAVHLPSHVLESRETAINGVAQVLAGECLQVVGDSATSTLYWNPVAIANADICEDRVSAVSALHRTVRGCVQSWANTYGDIVLRLSGGIDSSIVLGCLAKASTSSNVICVNYFSHGSDSDERNYARLAAAAASRQLVERERDPSIRLERLMDMARTPNPSFYLGRLETGRMDAELAAARGASAVFTGIGGDQVFHQNQVVWPVADYARRHGLRRALFGAAMDAARLARVSVWAALRVAVRHGLLHGSSDPQVEVGAYVTLVDPAIVAAARSDTRFLHPALRETGDTPIGKLAHIRGLIFPTEYYDPLGSESDPERVHPLLSQPVVELCLRIPTYVLVNGGRDRALARQAFARDLPREIAGRRSKGGQEEHVKAILLRNLEFVRTMLLEGELVKQRLLDRSKLEEVLSGQPTTIASSVMELHTYLGIEAWLQRWSVAQQPAIA